MGCVINGVMGYGYWEGNGDYLGVIFRDCGY